MKITTVFILFMTLYTTAIEAAQIEIEGLHITGGTFTLNNAPLQEITNAAATDMMLQPTAPDWDLTQAQTEPATTSLASLQFAGSWINSYLDKPATGSIRK
ncbi:MAG: hypothetical protein V3W04_01040 [Gammaproteobacteria bacterium]